MSAPVGQLRSPENRPAPDPKLVLGRLFTCTLLRLPLPQRQEGIEKADPGQDRDAIHEHLQMRNLSRVVERVHHASMDGRRLLGWRRGTGNWERRGARVSEA